MVSTPFVAALIGALTVFIATALRFEIGCPWKVAFFGTVPIVGLGMALASGMAIFLDIEFPYSLITWGVIIIVLAGLYDLVTG